MDGRVPEFHHAAIRMVMERSATLEKVLEILTSARSESLTEDQVKTAISLLEAELPSPLRATLFDLGRLLSGRLPTDDIVPPPRLKIFLPEG